MPKFYIKNPYVFQRSGLSHYQKMFYGEIYRLRMMEQKRFTEFLSVSGRAFVLD